MTLPHPLKHTFATICYTLGLALAVYLALLKFFALPCVGPGNCQTILYSKFGSILHVPVGVYAALLWFGVIFIPNKDKRDVFLLMLAGGAAFFMVIQFFVLRGFCLYCTLHAVAAWGALFLHHERPRVWMAVLALALAGGGFQLARTHANHQAQSGTAQPAQLATLADKASALPWLGKIHPRSPAVILSFDCPSCIDLLEKLTKENFKNRDLGPALYFKVNDRNRALTLAVVASVLSQRELTRRDAFISTMSVLLMEKENVLASPDAAAARLAAFFPAALEKKEDAETILAAQAKTLSSINTGDTTPLLVTRAGLAQAVFNTGDLFP
ncbi:MAG: vitamin K epoxide reductase family protein [Nibricoccus sp.]